MNHYVSRYNDSTVGIEYWKNDADKYHRENGPAIIDYYDTGEIHMEQWYINDSIHRDNAPAIIKYDKKGHKIGYMWWNHGLRHREDGPAVMCYNEDGECIEKEYFWNYNKITDFVEKLFGCVPNELSKDQVVLLKLSLPAECFVK